MFAHPLYVPTMLLALTSCAQSVSRSAGISSIAMPCKTGRQCVYTCTHIITDELGKIANSAG